MHGKTSMIYHDKERIFNGIVNPFEATRYHSLAIERKSLSQEFKVIAWTKDKEIMGIRHKQHQTEGIQFHPESIMTPIGKRLLRNFINMKEA